MYHVVTILANHRVPNLAQDVGVVMRQGHVQLLVKHVTAVVDKTISADVAENKMAAVQSKLKTRMGTRSTETTSNMCTN